MTRNYCIIADALIVRAGSGNVLWPEVANLEIAPLGELLLSGKSGISLDIVVMANGNDNLPLCMFFVAITESFSDLV